MNVWLGGVNTMPPIGVVLPPAPPGAAVPAVPAVPADPLWPPRPAAPAGLTLPAAPTTPPVPAAPMVPADPTLPTLPPVPPVPADPTLPTLPAVPGDPPVPEPPPEGLPQPIATRTATMETTGYMELWKRTKLIAPSYSGRTTVVVAKLLVKLFEPVLGSGDPAIGRSLDSERQGGVLHASVFRVLVFIQRRGR
jgi:hypothetical protein